MQNTKNVDTANYGPSLLLGLKKYINPWIERVIPPLPQHITASGPALSCVFSCNLQLIRKEGDFQAPRLLDEKDMRANEDMQMKKKNRKSGTPCKVREQDGRGGKVSGNKP